MEVLIVFVAMLIPISYVVVFTWYFLVIEYQRRNIKWILDYVEYERDIRKIKWEGVVGHYDHLTKYHKCPF